MAGNRIGNRKLPTLLQGTYARGRLTVTGRSGIRTGTVLKVAAFLLALPLACALVLLVAWLMLPKAQTTEEMVRGPAVVKGCDARGSTVVVTAEVFNPTDRPLTLSMGYWAEDEGGNLLTEQPAPHVSSTRLQPGERQTLSGVARLLEGADPDKIASCDVTVR